MTLSSERTLHNNLNVQLAETANHGHTCLGLERTTHLNMPTVCDVGDGGFGNLL